MGPTIVPRFIHTITFRVATSLVSAIVAGGVQAQEATRPVWAFSEDQLRPFWKGEVMEGESVLFIKDEKMGNVPASVLFPIRRMLSVRSSSGEVRYEEGRDYAW